MTVVHHANKNDYLKSKSMPKAKTSGPLNKVDEKVTAPENPIEKTPVQQTENPDLSKASASSKKTSGLEAASDIAQTAKDVAKKIASAPTLPLATTAEKLKGKSITADKKDETPKIINKPAIFYIEGLDIFSAANSDGLKEMHLGTPGSELFTWKEKSKILEAIQKRSPDQPIILVGHSLGGDAAVKISETLNTPHNGFREVDLLVTLDAVGLENDIMPTNVKRHLNFFAEKGIPLLHDGPHIARSNDLTDVVNELRSEDHTQIDDLPDIQFKIFHEIQDVLNEYKGPDLKDVIVIQRFADFLKDLNQKN